MDKFREIVFSVARGSDWLARGALMVLAVFIVTNVVTRMLHIPIMGGYELIGLIGGMVVAFSIAYCQVRRGHVYISVVIERFPQRIQAIIDTITSIIGVALFMLLTWQCIEWGIQAAKLNRFFGVLPVPLNLVIYGVGFGSFMLGLVLVVHAYKFALKVRRGQE